MVTCKKYLNTSSHAKYSKTKSYCKVLQLGDAPPEQEQQDADQQHVNGLVLQLVVPFMNKSSRMLTSSKSMV